MEDRRKSSQARIDANARYDKKTYDNILVKFRKDAALTSAAVKTHAISRGESINGFITRAIAETIERDRERDNQEQEQNDSGPAE